MIPIDLFIMVVLFRAFMILWARMEEEPILEGASEEENADNADNSDGYEAEDEETDEE